MGRREHTPGYRSDFFHGCGRGEKALAGEQAALGEGGECEDFADFIDQRNGLLDGFDGSGSSAVTMQTMKRGTDGMDGISIDARALASDGVVSFEATKPDGGEGWDIARDGFISTDDRQATDARELVNGASPAEKRPASDGGISTEHAAVGEDDIVTDLRVMPDMRAGHQKTPCAQARGMLGTGSESAMDLRGFPNDRAVGDEKGSGFTGITQMVRVHPDVRRRTDFATGADDGVTFDDAVGMNNGSRAERHAAFENGVRSDLDIISQLGQWIDDCSGMDARHGVSP